MNTYATVQDMRDRGVPDEVDDLEILRALARATVVIDAYCGRDFFRREEAHLVDGSGRAAIFLDDRPIIEVAELRIDDAPVDPESFRVYRDAGYVRLVGEITIFAGHPGVFTAGAQNVEVRGVFGFETVPPEVKEACVLLAVMFLRMMRGEANVMESQANSTDRAIGISSVRIDDLSVSYEYPREAVVASRRRTTGLAEADRLLWRHRRDLEAIAV